MQPNERRSLVRAASIALGCCMLVILEAPRLLAGQPLELPNTAAGRYAAAYFRAFNSGNVDTMLAFFEGHYSFSYLETNPVERRTANYRRLLDTFGTLAPLRVAQSLELQLTVVADAEKTDNALVIRFQIESAAPNRLAYVSIGGMDHADVPDEYVAYVAARSAPLDLILRESTVRSVAEVLASAYVYPALGAQMADTLLRNLAIGRYNVAAKAGKLADMLTQDAQTVSNDKHVWIEAQNPMLQESSDPVNDPVEELRRANYHVRKIEILPGEIGIIKFDMIHDDPEALVIAAAALDSVSRCTALIFDIRDNVGGEWGTAGLILGYLLPAGTVINRVYDRDGNRVEERTVPGEVPGKPFGAGVPVYVLTSGRTGSAAEAFAYALQALKRATIVGEATLGMAHPSEEIVANDYFRVSVPSLRSENAVTGTDWEGSGVKPEIETSADRALEAAVADARRRMTAPK